ncbi:MAG: PilZ domain-containing protein [Candidatus Omnitrophota bacterium]|nr:PilZ domain-containing protein [Candidatus Omnitrophota bacterium]
MAGFEERRKHKRFPVPIFVDASGRKFLQFKKLRNLSLGGIFIETHLLESPGTLIEMNFVFHVEKEKIKVLGEVAWVCEEKNNSGMGIRFIHPPAEFLKKIEKMYLE